MGHTIQSLVFSRLYQRPPFYWTLYHKIPRIRQGGQARQQDGPAVDLGKVKCDPVIAGSHGERINAFNIERHQINLVGPAGEIRHRIRLVPGSEHEHVRAGTAGQTVIPLPAVEGIILLISVSLMVAVPCRLP